jgi:ATP-independent RNA helicase DbpA
MGRVGPSRRRRLRLRVAAAGRADSRRRASRCARRCSTLQILGGRKEKIRPGDVLGALTKDMGFAGTQIGKINVNEFSTYVAVDRQIAAEALRKLSGRQGQEG